MPVFDVHTYMEGFLIPGVNQNADQISQTLTSRRIERGIVFSARAAQADPLTGNRILKGMVEQQKGLFGGVVAHLNRIDASLQSIRELMTSPRILGLMLVTTRPGEPLVPQVAEEILSVARRYHKPVFVHTPNAACVHIALQLAQKYNTHKFVFLGMGGMDWRSGIAAASQSSNIFLEISGPLDRAKIPAAIEGIGQNRVLFGSGMPQMDPAAALGLIDDSDIATEGRKRILQENAKRLFNTAEVEAGPSA